MAAEFFIHNLGCKVNRVESDTITAALLAAGGTPVARDQAEVILVNTCTVTGEADTKTRKVIRQSLNAAGKPWVIATGCSTAIAQDTYKQLGARVIVEPDRLAAQQKAMELLGLHESASTLDHTAIRCGEHFRTRLGIKIQDGCDNACAYCIVPAARGAAHSVPASDIIQQARIADNSSVREVIVTGVNIGAYTDDGRELADLLELLLASTTRLRFRLSSLEPQYLSDQLIDVICGSGTRLCAHLHLPLQSGCDKVLAQMGRCYTTGFFRDRLDTIRGCKPQLAVTTDIMVGFPGESERDFLESLEFCEAMRFSRIHVFRYSKRPGTPASECHEQVKPEIVNKRATAMRELSRLLEVKDMRSRVGTVEAVLVEGVGRGMSESYHQVVIPRDVEKGQLVWMQFDDYRDTLLHGQIMGFM